MAYLEVSIKHLIKVDPPHLKIIQGVSNSVTVRGGMRKSEIDPPPPPPPPDDQIFETYCSETFPSKHIRFT